jgi:hypothetical protein
MIRKLDLEQRARAVVPEISLDGPTTADLATNRVRPWLGAALGVRRGCHRLRGVALPLVRASPHSTGPNPFVGAWAV